MTIRTVCVTALALFAWISPCGAQNSRPIRIGVSLGPSLVTGTPEREPPVSTEHLTGASGVNEVGRRIALLADVRTPLSWVRLGAEAFRNKITADKVGYNCIHDSSVPVPNPTSPHKICYLAASSDIAAGLLAGPIVRVRWLGTAPFAAMKIGAAHYDLSRPASVSPTSEGITTSHTRFAYKATIGAELRIGNHAAFVETGLVQGLGRGAGTSHIPLMLGFLF